MQVIRPYEIVLSLAGHDKGRLYLVLGEEGGRLLLADGRGRKLDAPKRKSAAHVRSVGTSAHPAVENCTEASRSLINSSVVPWPPSASRITHYRRQLSCPKQI